MKFKIYLTLAVATAVMAMVGCVDTVNGRKTAGVPFIKDSVEGRYERSIDQAFAAARAVISESGVLNSESTLHDQTNAVKVVEGKINQRKTWVRIEAVEPNVISVIVQTRTPGGVSDLDLAHEVEKEIALKLAAAR